jgi:TraB/PrgY/gumN family
MITLYTDQDIDKFDDLFSNPQLKETKYLLLVHRNIKMAQRMDSMAHIRNSFFAVGAAHLPGEDGLIKLLQAKGFSVTPVFSSKKIAPEKYSYAAKEIPWVRFVEKDSAYSVEMPGKASDLDVAAGEMKFKVYADLVTNIFYMTGYTFYGTEESQEAVMARMQQSFATRGFEKLEEKKITNKGISGSEMIAIIQKMYYRLQIYIVANKVYMVMTGGEKKENLYAADVDRFLAGFSMNAAVTAKPNTWVNHNDTLKAFDVSFHKKPVMDKLKKGETVKNIETTTYTALDIPNNTYYMVVVNETAKGFMMNEDSVVFNDKLNYYKTNKAVITDERKFLYEGNAAMSFAAATKHEGLDFITKLLVICRGNRTYTVAVVAQKGKEDYPDITRFFRSFKLTPFKQPVWAKNESNGNSFSTWSPAVFEKQLPDTTGLSGYEMNTALNASEKRILLIAHDVYAATSFNVSIHPVSKYYHAKNDSTFLADQLAIYFTDTSAVFAKINPGKFDSLVQKKAIVNGNVKGYEIVVKNASESYYKKVRILPHGDSSYHLYVLGAYDYINGENSNKFFNNFRFHDEILPSAFLKSKTAAVLADIVSGDSATKSEALEFMGTEKFDSIDLPLLHQAYLKEYPKDSMEYTTINEKIGDAINTVNDISTVSFVKENYVRGTVHLPELKIDMLEMLARQQTKPATAILKELLLKVSPVKGNANSFIYSMSDSLLLAADLFPEAASFFGDSILGPGMIRLASELVDSNLLKKEIIKSNADAILQTARLQLAQLKKDDYPSYNNYVIDALQKINNKQAVALLNSFVKAIDPDVKQNAIIALLKNKQSVSAVEIHRIAADKGYRTSFYKLLSDIGRQEIFTLEFLTQPQFAEAYIYNYAIDEDAENTVCKLQGERTAMINGTQKRFYLFKVSFNYDDQTENHLAICGAFDTNKKIVVLDEAAIKLKIFYEEKFSTLTINKLFDQFIKGEKDKGVIAGAK